MLVTDIDLSTSDAAPDLDLPLQITIDILQIIIQREKYVTFSLYSSFSDYL